MIEFTHPDFDVKDVANRWSEGFERQVSKALHELKKRIASTDLAREMEKAVSEGYSGFGVYENPFLGGRSAQTMLAEIQTELKERGYAMYVTVASEVIVTFDGEHTWHPKNVETVNHTILHKPFHVFEAEQLAAKVERQEARIAALEAQLGVPCVQLSCANTLAALKEQMADVSNIASQYAHPEGT